MDETQKFFDDLVEAVGSKVTKDPEIKRAFVDAIVQNIALSNVDAELILPKKSEEVISAAKELGVALKHFSTMTTGLLDVGPAAHAESETSPRILEDMTRFLRAFQQEVQSRTVQDRSGPNNFEALAIGKMIALEYKRFFGHWPKTGNDNEDTNGNKVLTPYDRICLIIAKNYCPGGKMAISTRRAAIDAVKMGGTIRPNNAP